MDTTSHFILRARSQPPGNLTLATLNDWRMLDVETGQPIFLSNYTAEQFCMNHPDFRRPTCITFGSSWLKRASTV